MSLSGASTKQERPRWGLTCPSLACWVSSSPEGTSTPPSSSRGVGRPSTPALATWSRQQTPGRGPVPHETPRLEGHVASHRLAIISRVPTTPLLLVIC